jgi:2-C-methyl-D-erythritol 4-phosphate cytidylyltransferase/2-C-methyl-D-erythritol 2,4-cyclodiphosphate synthase
MKVAALIVAGGSGSRAGGELPKQYQGLLGRSVVSWSIDALMTAGVQEVVAVVGLGHEAFFRSATNGRVGVQTVIGGATRTNSVRAGLAALGDADIILIHDAARPGLTAQIVGDLVEAVRAGAPAVAPALPVADALQRTDGRGQVREEVDRADLYRVQTPQAFDARILRDAYARAAEGTAYTDDLAIVRAIGAPTKLITGDARLMKVTYPKDLEMLATMLSENRITCVGNGIDAHRFGPGDFVTLCGVQVPHDKGLLGHSDADAGWHALVDAILGALGEGDIGAHFPPSDPQWKGADSERFLRHALQLADAAGAKIVHVDVTLVCERPKVGPHREAMRARTAQVLDLPLDRVSVKATTTERMGFLGREEGLAAYATATLTRPA